MIASITESPPPSQYGPPVRVIIVGACVAGLTLAHCLDKAGIDYLMLDKVSLRHHSTARMPYSPPTRYPGWCAGQLLDHE